MTSKGLFSFFGQWQYYRGLRTFRIAMQLVHLGMSFLMKFPKGLKKQVFMQTMQRLMVIAITCYLYTYYVCHVILFSQQRKFIGKKERDVLVQLFNFFFRNLGLMWFGCCLFRKRKKKCDHRLLASKAKLSILRYGLTWKLKIKERKLLCNFSIWKNFKKS